MSRILITGATGFTGRYLAQLLAQEGHGLYGFGHADEPAAMPSGLRLYEGDLCDLTEIRRVVFDVQPDHVVHLAAIAFVGHSEIDQMYLANVLGTRHLLQALSELPRRPRSVLLASSANIYGNSKSGVLDETVPAAPANDYGVTKVAMEYVASIYRAVLPLIIARPFNYTGRGQSTKFIIPKIVDHIRRRAPIIELGNIEVSRDFLDVRSVADAYVRLLSEPSAIGRTFNVCSGRAIALRDILALATELSGHQLEPRMNDAFVRPNEVSRLCGSPALIESVIGHLRSIPLEETLRWMLDA